jgi:manganese transport protein
MGRALTGVSCAGSTVGPMPGLPADARTRAAARAALEGRRRRPGALLPFLGPAFVASVAYLDPGNFATNLTAGSQYGYRLLWAVLAANLVAMLVQLLAARLGIATGRNLAELCRERFPRPVTVGLWVQAELVAMATDLAEVIGGAIGIHLMFGTSLPIAGLLAGAASFAILALQRFGFRRLEAVIMGFVATIVVGIAAQLAIAPPDAGAVAVHAVVPSLDGRESVLIAVGIVGATVMPHAIYVHSALTQDRIPTASEGERVRSARYARHDVLAAMALAGLVNMAMLAAFAGLLAGTGVESIQAAFHVIRVDEGHLPALALGVALLASGVSSGSVGTLAGQVVMSGFLRLRVPLMARRAVTLLPALAILTAGVDPTRALVVSQVVLSFGLPFALVPLVRFTGQRRTMGSLASSRPTAMAGWTAALLVTLLNAYLLAQYVV